MLFRSLALADAEASVLGGSHADVGAWLGGQWNLPEPVLEAVGQHHAECLDSDGGLLSLCAVVQLADELACERGFDGGEPFDGRYSGLARGAGMLAQRGGAEWSPEEIRELAAAEAPELEGLVGMVYER